MSFKITANRIEIKQKDTFYLPLDFHYDITGACLVMQVRDKETGALLMHKSIQDHIDPLSGKALIRLDSQDTDLPVGEYETDIKIVFPNKDEFTFFPAQATRTGSFCVSEKITREVTDE